MQRIRLKHMFLIWAVVYSVACSSNQVKPRLAFEHIEQDRKSLYIVSLAPGQGVGPTSVVPLPYHNMSTLRGYEISPSGERIAWSEAKQDGTIALWVFNGPTNDSHLVTDNLSIYRDFPEDSGLAFAWSPSSDMLAFLGETDSGFLDVFIYDPNTEAVRNLTNDQLGHNSLAWSHNGQMISFVTRAPLVSSQDNSLNRTGQPGRIEYITVSSGARQLVVDLSQDTHFAKLMEHQTNPCYPTWSWDDQFLAFRIGCRLENIGYSDILVSDIRAGSIWNVTNPGWFDYSEYANQLSFGWSPLDNRLAVGIFRQSFSSSPNADAKIRRLLMYDVEHPISDWIDLQDPPWGIIWSPDAKKLLWREVSSPPHLTLLDPATKQISSLPGGPIDGCSYAFSNDGNYLAIESIRSTEGSCFVRSNRDIKILSFKDGYINDLTQDLNGDNRLLTWIP